MKLEYRSLIILCAILFTGCASKKFVNIHPEYAGLSQKVERVVILPVEAQMEKLVFTGENEDLSEEAAQNSAAIQNLIETAIKSKSYEVVVLDQEHILSQEQDLAFHISQIRDNYSNNKSSMFSRLNPHMDTDELEALPVQADSATVQSLNYVASELDADAFVLARYYGFRKSAGLKTKEMASTVLLGLLTGSIIVKPASGHSLEVGMVEAATGHVLWVDSKNIAQIVIEDLLPVMDSLPMATRSTLEPELVSEESDEAASAEAI